MTHLTIPDQTPLVTYAAATGIGPYNVTFPITDEDDLRVAVDGVELAAAAFSFTPTTVATGGYQAGYITLSVAAAAQDVVLWRDIPLSRTDDFANGPLDMSALNTALDRLTAQVQDARLADLLAASAWLVGVGAPDDDSTGTDGQLYLNSATGDVYGPKDAGSWGSIVANLTGPTGVPGTNGTDGTNGADGATAAIKLVYSTTTADSDPGSGAFRLNSTTISSVTAGYFDNNEAGGNSIAAWLDTFDDSTSAAKGVLVLRGLTTATAFAVFSVSGSVVDGTGYRKLTLSHVASGGTFTNGEAFAVAFYRTGDKGNAGAGTGDLLAANNLSDLASAATARTNLGLGTAAVVADSSLVHISGTETITGAKTFSALSQHKYSSTATGADATGSATTNVGHRIGASNVGSSGYGIDIGVSNSDGTTWIQARDWSNYATNATLRLQPNGGTVTRGGNLMYDAGNLPGTAITWTARQSFTNDSSTPFDRATSAVQIEFRTGGVTQGYLAAYGGYGFRAFSSGGSELFNSSNSTGITNFLFPPTVSSVAINVAGKQAIPIPASAMTPRTTNGAAAGLTETTTNKVMLSTLDYDSTTQEFAQFSIAMPKGWNESTVSAQFIWTAASGSGGVQWGLRAVAMSDDDTLDAAFGTGQVVSDTFLAANDAHITAETSAITIAGSPTEGDIVYFEVYRVPADASDTLAVDAKLIAVRLFITTNAANDA